MKIVLNRCWGGFSLPKRYCEKYGCSAYDDGERTNPRLIAFVEKYPDEANNLKVFEIPDKSTDYMVNDYDGCESIIYVMDGKLHRM